MKKLLFAGLSIFLTLSAFADDAVKPKVIPDIYAYGMSSNGKWLYGIMMSEWCVYDVDKDKAYSYPGYKIAAMTDNGVAVSNQGGGCVFLYNDVVIRPEGRVGMVNDINPSGTRVCGMMNNRDKHISGPFYCEIDENGNFGEPVGLPKPELDLFGCPPQFINALAISDDGKTIAGFVQDWRGFFAYPIVYLCDDNGNWTYELPAEYLFNPDGLEIPENPYLNEPKFPEPTNYLYPDVKEVYEEELSNALMGLGEFPEVTDFMTNEQYAQYAEDVEMYNEWYYGNFDKIQEYFTQYGKIMSSSVSFGLNDIALNENGESLISPAFYYDKSGDTSSESFGIYILGTRDKSGNRVIKSQNTELKPKNFLADGTIVVTMPINIQPDTFIALPGSDEFIRLIDYFREAHPSYVDWMEKNVPDAAGFGSASSDLSVFAMSVMPDDCTNYLDVIDNYNTFVYLYSSEESGVSTLEEETSPEIYTVYNLQGINVLTTGDESQVKELPKGLYLVNGKKVIISN